VLDSGRTSGMNLRPSFNKIFYYSSDQKDYFPFMEDFLCFKSLKKDVTHIKLLYRSFIFPWKELLAKIPSDKTICDIGFGHGYFLLLIMKMYPRTRHQGLEVSKKLITDTQALFKDTLFSPLLTLYDGIRFPKTMQKADIFVVNDVYHHIPSALRKSFIDNLSAYIPENKILIFKDIDASDLFCSLFNKLHDLVVNGEFVKEISLKEATLILTANGFQVESVQKVRKFVYSHFIITATKRSVT
jgi:methylase of polypeptide subunit release factors